jgi:ATP-dependent Lon protease
MENVEIADDDIKYIIDHTEEEAGVRNLKRSIEYVISVINLENLLDSKFEKNITITRKLLVPIMDKYKKQRKEEEFNMLHKLYK